MPQHKHYCSTPNCPDYYVCSQRDCRDTWQCPRCEDDEIFDDIQRMEAQFSAVKEISTWQS